MNWREAGENHDVELHNFFTSPNIIKTIIKEIEMGRFFSTHEGDEINVHNFS